MYNEVCCLVVLDQAGTIVGFNSTWEQCEFSPLAGKQVHMGENYVSFCETRADIDAASGRALAEYLRELLTGETEEFYLQYVDFGAKGPIRCEVRGSRSRWQDAMGAIVSHRRLGTVERGGLPAETGDAPSTLGTSGPWLRRDEAGSEAIHNHLASVSAALRAQVERVQRTLPQIDSGPYHSDEEAARGLKATIELTTQLLAATTESAQQLQPLIDELKRRAQPRP